MAVKVWRNWQRQKWVELTHNLASASFSDQRLPRWLVRWVSCTAASPLPPCRVKPGYFLTVFNCMVMVQEKLQGGEIGLLQQEEQRHAR